jgi:uroporphyrinogen-III synthase
MSISRAYVLSTRPLSEVLLEEAAAKGVTIDVVSFIGTTRLQDETLSKRLAELVKQPVTAVFASVNAVTAIEGKERPDWKIFCISGATRRAAEERFGREAIVAVADSAKELAAVIIGREGSGEIWFFCGDRRREELPDRLKAAGCQVHEVVVYQTILTPHRIDKTYDAIVFFSPSAVESFFSMNIVGPQVPLFAIGRTTAAALHQHGPNPVTISEKPDEQLLIRQLIKSIDEHTQE